MSGEWLTLNQAAKQLGLSTRTLRRWIHDGKIQAELTPGPYGHQYLVPIGELNSLQVTRDLERVQREADLESLASLLALYLSQREGDLLARVDALQARMLESLQRVVQTQETIVQELARLRAEVERMQAER